MRLAGLLSHALLMQRGHLIGWASVCLGLGIGLYFTVPAEPGMADYTALLILAAAGLGAARIVGAAMAPLAVAVTLVALGVMLAGARAHTVAEPVLTFRYYGPIEGRIIRIDRSASDAVRLTLDRVVLARMAPDRTPARVRVSLHEDQGWIVPEPGMTVILTGHLTPPSGPVEPGGYDFRRNAWFDRLGAVGYTRTPVLALAPAEGAAELWIHRRRMEISTAVQAALPGERGAFAAAILTGDRSGIGQGTTADLRAANLAHLLAISGLHMGLLTGFVFGLIRYGLALVPALALRVDTKKIAALSALGAGAAYLALSGAAVATERAYIMVAVMLIAVLLDRRAITLRAVAIAALIVLLRRPEELMGPGFQMSFAATAALVAVFGAIRRFDWRAPRRLRPVVAVVLSSFVAGAATAPFAAAHFNQISQFGLVANVASVPVMGAVVMPAAVLAAILAPLGLAAPALWVMDKGLGWILWVAHFIAAREGAVDHVLRPDPWVLPLLSFGAVWLILWQGWGRLAGLLPVIAAFALWGASERPALLISDTGGLIGVMTKAGRALSKPQGDGFAADSWLEDDGAPVPQEIAHGRAGFAAEGMHIRANVAGTEVLQVRGTRAAAALDGCGGADILILTVADDAPRPCEVFDLARLRQTGAIAGRVQDGTLTLVTAQEVAGERLWSRSGPPHTDPGRTGFGGAILARLMAW